MTSPAGQKAIEIADEFIASEFENDANAKAWLVDRILAALEEPFLFGTPCLRFLNLLTKDCAGHTMLTQAPISHHLDLYRYWLAKRGARVMPARSDLDPGEIYALLPYLTILDKADGQFRYRLHGSAVARELGRDLTGGIVGSYVNTPESAAAMRALCERVFARAKPVFTTGEFIVKSGLAHNISVLFLPLSEDGVTVNMAVCTLVARFNFGVTPSAGWLEGIPVKVGNVIEVRDAAQLEKCCLDWNRRCAEDD